MIQCLHVALNSPEQLRSLSPRLVLFMTSARVRLSQTPSAAYLSTWTSTAGCSALHVSRLIMGAGWRQLQTPNTSLYSGAASFVWSPIGIQLTQLLTITHFPLIPDWFDVLDEQDCPILTEREVLRNLQAIVADADKLPTSEVARNALGVLTTENRKVWSGLRRTLSQDRRNAACLRVVDQALFVVCLDDAAPEGLAELCGNFLCGSYRLAGGVQVGTCTNRWYDKVRACLPGGHSINWNHDTCFILPAATDHCDG